MAVKVACHEDASAALISGTLAPQPVDFSVLVDLHTVQTAVSSTLHSVVGNNTLMGCSYSSAVQTLCTL